MMVWRRLCWRWTSIIRGITYLNTETKIKELYAAVLLMGYYGQICYRCVAV